jgi:hypothetical protein
MFPTGAARLGIDFGTNHTVAAIATPDGRLTPLLFDASPLLASGVYAERDGRLLTGQDAARAAQLDPGRSEPNPKLRIDEGRVVLGGREYPVVDLVAAVLRRVAAEAVRTLGGPPAEVVLTHPAAWGAQRRAVLTAAALEAGLGAVTLVPEPLAAARYFASVRGDLPAGATLAVYDFGGGTFDASLVRRLPDGGWEVLATGGLADIGGLDLEAAIIDHVGATVGQQDARRWRQLLSPMDDERRRQLWAFRADVRAAKEQLSRAPSVTLRVPVLGVDAYLTREEFERLAAPFLARTVDVTAAVVAERRGADLAGVFLVGGSSRIPLVATVLHRRLGVAPTAIEQPELVVAMGSAGTTAADLAAAPVSPASIDVWPVSGAPVSPPPVSAPPVSAVPVGAAPVSGVPVSAPGSRSSPPGLSAPRRGRRTYRKWVWPTAALALLALIFVPVYVAQRDDDKGGGERPGPGGGPTSTAEAQRGKRIQTVPINRRLWFEGKIYTIGTAKYDADRDVQLSIDFTVENTMPVRTSVSPEEAVLFTLGGTGYEGSFDSAPPVPGKLSGKGIVRFELPEQVIDLADGVLSFGDGTVVQARVALNAIDKAETLEPKLIFENQAVTVRKLEFTKVQCWLRYDYLEDIEQVEQGSVAIGCMFDVKLLATSLDYLLEPRDVRLKLPDGRKVPAATITNDTIQAQQVRRDMAATFILPASPQGVHVLQLVDVGRYHELPEEGGVAEIPMTLPPAG